jgi:phage N-6-adenine-methyltransferase
MNDLVPSRIAEARVLIRKHPERMRKAQAQADSMISAAASLERWDELEHAVDVKIAQQQEFVGWWDERVRASHRPKTVTTEVTVSAPDLTKLTGIGKMQVSRWRTHTADVDAYRQDIIAAARRAAELQAAHNHRAQGAGENDWFTPRKYIDAVRLLWNGTIDLDPASHPIAQEWIKAERFYTQEDNGLAREWHGRVFLNPPYSRDKIDKFICKMIHEIMSDHVEAAVILTHSYTDTAWFHALFPLMTAVCFVKTRIAFLDKALNTCDPTQGQVFLYYGENVPRFTEIFSSFGVIAYPKPFLDLRR